MARRTTPRIDTRYVSKAVIRASQQRFHGGKKNLQHNRTDFSELQPETYLGTVPGY